VLKQQCPHPITTEPKLINFLLLGIIYHTRQLAIDQIGVGLLPKKGDI